MMDAYAAWHIFEQTGKVEDYIRYSQMKSLKEFNSQEAIHADQHRRIGDNGEQGKVTVWLHCLPEKKVSSVPFHLLLKR